MLGWTGPLLILGTTLGITGCFGVTSGSLPFASEQPLWEAVLSDLRRFYFDPELQGLEIPALDRETGARTAESRSLGSALEEMDQTLERLEDSHTFVIPPTWTSYGDYGFTPMFVGDTAFVTSIAPGGAADLAGLRAGDEILLLGVDPPMRQSFQRIWYRKTLLNPRSSLTLVVRREYGGMEEVPIVPEEVNFPPFYVVPEGFEEWFSPWGPQTERAWRFVDLPAGVSLWRFDIFDGKDRAEFRDTFEALEESRALVLDLRENVGGSMDVLKEVIRHLFSEEVLVGTFLHQDKLAEVRVEPASNRGFKGDLVVLIGSGTGSAAEILAALVQEEGRGSLLGDRTAGAVMLSDTRRYEVQHPEGHWKFGLSVSVGEFRTHAGVLLEGRGVYPDETILPTRGDLRQGGDPVLSRALKDLGLDFSPMEAARIFSKRTGPEDRSRTVLQQKEPPQGASKGMGDNG